MKYPGFEDYLMEKCFEENRAVLDDDQPDFFDEWLCNLDVDDWIKYGNDFSKLNNKEK